MDLERNSSGVVLVAKIRRDFWEFARIKIRGELGRLLQLMANFNYTLMLCSWYNC